GVSAEDIQTQNVSLNPQRDRRNAITGYAASVSLRVTTRDLSKAGDLLEAGTKAGATEVWGPSLYLSETNEARTRAIDSAVADAKVRAERMAKAAGRSVGAVVSITEQGAVSTYPNYLSKYAMAGVALDAGAPGIQPGQMDAYAHVSVSFELK
ncbi:MAG TPA: SIMPL domain-containing protein, partial [Coriobacteriia bacterium]